MVLLERIPFLWTQLFFARLSIKVTVIRGAWVGGVNPTTNGVWKYILLESTIVGPNMNEPCTFLFVFVSGLAFIRILDSAWFNNYGLGYGNIPHLWVMDAQECVANAKEAKTLGNGLLRGRCSSVRQRGPSCTNVAARGVNELLSTVNRESAPHRESTSEIVRLFAVQPERNQNGRVCSVCNRIWLCWVTLVYIV